MTQFRFLLFISLALCAVWASSLNAQSYLYSLSLKGKFAVNGTVLDELAGDFDLDPVESSWEAWASLDVENGNRYALRRDGRLSMNGQRIYTLGWNGLFDWVSMDVSGGTIYQLRQDGYLAANDDLVAILPLDNFFFRKVLFHQGSTYSLRSDGKVFRNGEETPLFSFEAGPGVLDGGEGEELDTIWVAMDIDPASGNLYVLRADGKVYLGDFSKLNDPDEDAEELVSELPFPTFQTIFLDNLYADLEFAPAGGTWYVLSIDGRLFSSLSQIAPLVDYPGDATNDDNFYLDVATFDTDFYAVRGDGQLYRNLSTTEIIDLPGRDYGHIVLDDSTPILGDFENMKPVVAIYKTKTNVGTPLAVPVIATDPDTATEDLVVTPVQPLPAGSVWDPMSRTLNWANPGPKGKYKFKVTVSDGVNKPKDFTHKLSVKDPDTNPEKNKPPLLSKIKKAQALSDFEFRLPLIVDDPDGDPLSVTVDTTAFPFNTGAIYNPTTRVFTWTPKQTDIGKVTVVFYVSDGVKTKTLKVKIEVVGSLIIPPIP